MVNKDETLFQAKWSLKVTHKKADDLDKALKETRDDHLKTQDNIMNMHKESLSLSLSKELSKSLQNGFSIVEDDFESVFKQVEYFYSTSLIS